MENNNLGLNLLVTFYDFLEVGRWLNTKSFLFVFLPEVFFFFSVTLVFIIWLVRVNKLKKPLPLSELNSQKWLFLDFIDILTTILILTVLCYFLIPGFPSTFGGFAQMTLMFQYTLYTQGLKIFILILMIIFLEGSVTYFNSIFFPIQIDLNKKLIIPDYRYIEYFFIMFYGVGFTLLLLSSLNLISVLLTIEGLSFCLYILTGFKINSQYSLEAAVKYFFYGAISFGFCSLGILILYLEVGSVNFYSLINYSPVGYKIYPTFFILFNESIDYISGNINTNLFFMLGVFLIFISLIFKLGGAPFHFWIPDIYEGAPYPTTIFMATVGKVGFCGILFKLCGWVFVTTILDWSNLFLFTGVLSLFIGSFGALGQKRIKRFFAYSSITHVGFLLITLGLGDFLPIHESLGSSKIMLINSFSAGLFYLIVYVLTILVLLLLFMNIIVKKTGKPPIYFTDLQGLFRSKKSQGFYIFSLFLGISILLLSMAGIPPFLGFFTKFYILLLLVKYKYNFLILCMIVATVLGVFYYFRILKILFFEENKNNITNIFIVLNKKGDKKFIFKWISGIYNNIELILISSIIVLLTLIIPLVGLDVIFTFFSYLLSSLRYPELPFNQNMTNYFDFIPYSLPMDYQITCQYGLRLASEDRAYFMELEFARILKANSYMCWLTNEQERVFKTFGSVINTILEQEKKNHFFELDLELQEAIRGIMAKILGLSSTDTILQPEHRDYTRFIVTDSTGQNRHRFF